MVRLDIANKESKRISDRVLEIKNIIQIMQMKAKNLTVIDIFRRLKIMT